MWADTLSNLSNLEMGKKMLHLMENKKSKKLETQE